MARGAKRRMVLVRKVESRVELPHQAGRSPDDAELLPGKDAKGEDETAPAARGRHPTRKDVRGGRQGQEGQGQGSETEEEAAAGREAEEEGQATEDTRLTQGVWQMPQRGQCTC